MKEIIERLKAETPLIFKRIQLFASWLLGAGVGLVGVPAALNQIIETDIDLSIMVKIASYMIVFGLGIGAVAKLPKVDKSEDGHLGI